MTFIYPTLPPPPTTTKFPCKHCWHCNLVCTTFLQRNSIWSVSWVDRHTVGYTEWPNWTKIKKPFWWWRWRRYSWVRRTAPLCVNAADGLDSWLQQRPHLVEPSDGIVEQPTSPPVQKQMLLKMEVIAVSILDRISQNVVGYIPLWMGL